MDIPTDLVFLKEKVPEEDSRRTGHKLIKQLQEK